MKEFTTLSGFILVPFGVSTLNFVRQNKVSILWSEEELKEELNKTSFQRDEDSPSQVIPVTINIPFVLDGFDDAPLRLNVVNNIANGIRARGQRADREIRVDPVINAPPAGPVFGDQDEDEEVEP